MMTDKTLLHFQLAQKYSNIQILMPQIPSLMIQKGIGFVHNEGQVYFSGNFGILTFKFYVLFKGEQECKPVFKPDNT